MIRFLAIVWMLAGLWFLGRGKVGALIYFGVLILLSVLDPEPPVRTPCAGWFSRC